MYRNMKRSESTEQIAVINWCDTYSIKYPELKMIFHIPNGGQRNKIEAARLKREGVKAGVPDLFLPISRQGYNGLFIEMKYESNKATEKQKEWLKKLNREGFKAIVCNGFEEAVSEIEAYISKKQV